ncbi:MAG: GWxTD domain-containing protein [Gemmatimonadota bacterium]|nr:GWxTD domain-containing protein [Gemmatimonadota bacterium]
MTRTAAFLLALSGLCAPDAGAQKTSLADARASLEAGDTTAALAKLDGAIRSDARDAPAWHLRGMLAWDLARPHKRDGVIQTKRYIDLSGMADSSLRLAAQHAPDSAKYLLDLGKYLMSSTHASVRFAATDAFKKGMQAAGRSGDNMLLSQAADNAGEGFWRRYEPLANRRNLSNGFAFADLDRYITEPRSLENYLDNFTFKVRPPLGEGDYRTASDLFHAALEADPNSASALKHVFMVLVDRGQWLDLRQVAGKRLSQAPWDPWAWLASGLASHRLGEARTAVADFDSALTYFSPENRLRFSRLTRIMRPADTVSFTQLNPAERARTERMYWLLSDPLALTSGNEYGLEFLSRVAFAELRWSSEAFGVRGADSDRGEVYIRYGPAPFVLSLPPGADGYVPIIWRYTNGLSFQFTMRSTGAADFSFDLRDTYAQQMAALPVAWGNVPISRRIDSLTVQTVRFRAPGDSVDVVLHAELPLDRMTRGTALSNGAIDMGFFAFDGKGHFLVRDSTREDMAFNSSSTVRTWRHRLPRIGVGYRVEALQPDSMRAARALGVIETLPEPAFGISDLLIAERATPRAGTAASRWSDMIITPSSGIMRPGQAFSLMWETYGLTATAESSNSYTIDLSLRRTDGSVLSSFLARVLGGTASGAESRSTGKKGDGLRLSFNRNTAARPEMLDYLSLDLGEAPPGKYRIAITVTDLPSKQSVTTERDLTIVP